MAVGFATIIAGLAVEYGPDLAALIGSMVNAATEGRGELTDEEWAALEARGDAAVDRFKKIVGR